MHFNINSFKQIQNFLLRAFIVYAWFIKLNHNIFHLKKKEINTILINQKSLHEFLFVKKNFKNKFKHCF